MRLLVPERRSRMNPDKIILFAKQPGETSFASLFTIKRALGTQKVGHTGTLDSFACGLLVVCAGNLTRLASRITEMCKTYQAVIRFGAETDTLECTGSVVRTAALPSKAAVEKALMQFRGALMQRPPLFSAVHVAGRRASDVVRSGAIPVLPERQITVYDSQILEWKYADGGVSAVRVQFQVSKGTYIRSLARDIASACGSAAHLAGLYRTAVGAFSVKDAAGFDLLEEFTIDSALCTAEKVCAVEKQRACAEKDLSLRGIPKREWKTYLPKKNRSEETEAQLRMQVSEKAVCMNRALAEQCGFACLTLHNGAETVFRNGGKLRSAMFTVSPLSVPEEYAAVFTADGRFAGLLHKNSSGFFEYVFVNADMRFL